MSHALRREDRDEEGGEEKGAGSPFLALGRSSLSFEQCKVATSVVAVPRPRPISSPSSSPPTPYKERHKLPRNLVSPDIKDFPITLPVFHD